MSKYSSLWQSLVNDGYNVGTEEEFREKLKTHKKIIKEGENIWVPIDSLNFVLQFFLTILIA